MRSAVTTAVAAAAPERYVLARPDSALLRLLLALLAGALLATSFAPLDLWPLAVLAPAALMWLWQDATPREAARLGFWFNFATFAAGTYWLYISVHGFGGAPLWLAFFLMLGLVGIMGLYHAGLGYAVARWLPQRGVARWLVALPAAWLLVEWWRGWFLSGFSWLSLGYSQTDTWLAGFAPIAGVYGVSALLLLSAGALTALVCGGARVRVVAAVLLIVPWAAGAALYRHSWTQPSGPDVSVAVVQGAIPQDEKWLEKNRDTTLNLYQSLTEKVLGTDLIVWPESAPADTANDLIPYISHLYREARAQGSALVIGVLRADADPHDPGATRYYNSVLALDDGKASWYDKHHLVPFAEFFPVPQFVRSWLRLMSLPYSDFTPGAARQPPLAAAHLQLGTTVCYEDAYGSSMLTVLPRADALVNVTNDAWFGHSSARHQHFQIARMRALEAGRYMVRAANDGISAVIGPHGEVIARAPEFKPVALVSKIAPYGGLTPYARVGNWLVVSLATLALAYGVWVRNDRGRRPPGRRASID
ncbi:MAG TPA: apolipoprotein N-acyltransferase [Steroidobacteraceae bacterium]|nr:apolipoprotein N-acyltransferase [Steroidobacteraceae bacterium]